MIHMSILVVFFLLNICSPELALSLFLLILLHTLRDD